MTKILPRGITRGKTTHPSKFLDISSLKMFSMFAENSPVKTFHSPFIGKIVHPSEQFTLTFLRGTFSTTTEAFYVVYFL